MTWLRIRTLHAVRRAEDDSPRHQLLIHGLVPDFAAGKQLPLAFGTGYVVGDTAASGCVIRRSNKRCCSSLQRIADLKRLGVLSRV